MSTASKQPAESFQPERVETELQQVSLSSIVVRPTDFAFRDDDQLDVSSEALKSLAEDIRVHGGLHTPVLLKRLPDGRFLLLDGHRRYHALLSLVQEGVEGFAADKGVGKTSLASQIVWSAMDSDPHLGAVVYSLDMAKSRIYERLLCLEARIAYRSFRDPNKSADVQQRISEAHERIRSSIAPRLRVVERSFAYERDSYQEDSKAYRKGLRAGDVIDDCNRLLALGDVHRIVLVFDLFQKIIPFGDVADGAATDHYRLDLLSEVMKKTAGPDQPRGFPILVTSEIRKDAHKDDLTMNDLKGDGRMASDADVVMLIWPDPNSAQNKSDVVPTVLRVDKGREGVVRGDVKLWFEHPCFRFHDTEPETANGNLDHMNKKTLSTESVGPGDDPLGQ
ncbi:MAG: ParB N-terminal domain-containing protein [Candidatus Nealsonbacteria bacterium]|nr:ParB N-terminal domain-containing protein [Candidatus Nealsonbacteria bacterium]